MSGANNEAYVDDSMEMGTKKGPIDNGPRVVTSSNGVHVAVEKGVTKDDKEAEAERLKEKKRNRKPLLYCKFITSYPKTSFFLTLGAHLLMVFIMAALFQVGYDIFPIVFDRIPLDIQDNEYYLRGLSWDHRNEDSFMIERGSDENQTERSQVGEVVVWIYFMENGGNILTTENLQSMQTAEESLYNDNQFQTKYCLIRNATCSKTSSILRFFDGTYSNADPVFYDPTYSNIVQVIYQASLNNQTKRSLENMVGKDFSVSSTAASVSTLRGSITMGLPLAGYVNDTDRETEQTDNLKAYLEGEFTTLIDKLYQDKVGNVGFVYTSGTLIGSSITSFVFRDMSLLIGSLVFIFLFMCFQLKSFFIAGFAVLSIVTSFCTTNLVYRIVLDYRYIGIFHILALFIILGIGADDVFVFVDTWKETSHSKYKSLAHRLSDCYRRAAMAMMYTSLTTAIAFVVSATSPFLGIRTFGVFAGLLVCINYLSVIIYFPTVVIMYHNNFEKFKCCCCCPREAVHSEDGSVDTTHHRKNAIVRFFKGPYYRFVTHKIARWCIMGFFVIKLAVFIYFATQVQVNEEQTKFLPENTNIGKYLALSVNDFPPGDDPQRISIIFGLRNQNLDSCHPTNATCFGTTVWDDSFNLNDAGTQEALLALCNDIKSLSDAKVSELNIRRNSVTNTPEVKCFMEDLQIFMDGQESRTNSSGSAIYPAGTDFMLPVNESQAKIFMNTVPVVYDTSLLSSSYNGWFEIGASYWLYNGFSSVTGVSQDFRDYNSLIGESEESYTIRKNIANLLTYKYATRLRYAAILVNTTINARTIGYPTGIPIRDAWESYISGKIAELPAALQGGYQATPQGVDGFDLWHWMDVQKTLVSSAVLGIGVGIGLAFPILVFATMNIFTGLLATINIACITLCVVGFIPILGWKLGLLESLNLVLVVGLAVDYCVHLAEGYSRSVHTDRKSRVRDALEEVGISVLSGCVTTMGASFFLFFAVVLFFTQFGIFLFCTIALSILYSLVFFITLLGIIGPQNNFGSLKPLFDKCFSRCKCCNDEEGD